LAEFFSDNQPSNGPDLIWGIALSIALHLPDAPKIGRIDSGYRALTGEPRKRIHSDTAFA
jgi:hypothetical protein